MNIFDERVEHIIPSYSVLSLPKSLTIYLYNFAQQPTTIPWISQRGLLLLLFAQRRHKHKKKSSQCLSCVILRRCGSFLFLCVQIKSPQVFICVYSLVNLLNDWCEKQIRSLCKHEDFTSYVCMYFLCWRKGKQTTPSINQNNGPATNLLLLQHPAPQNILLQISMGTRCTNRPLL